MIKIGIVGAGSIAKAHSKAILNNEDCILTAVCDTVEERAAEIAQIHNAEVFTDYKDMCEKADMDAVILNLPHFLHCDAAVFFLEKNIHVLVEKPMAINVPECEKMINASKKSGAKLAIGHVQRYYSAYRAVKEIVQSGKYGKLCMITEVRNVEYATDSRPAWFKQKKLAGGGITMNYGAHTLDKIMYISGERVVEAKAYLSNPVSNDDIEVNAQILLKLTGGVTANITYCGCPGPREYATNFYFTNGAVKVAGGSDLCLYEDGKWVNYGGTINLIEEQLVEFLKYLNGEESEVVSPEYGKDIIRVLEEILN